MKNTTLIFVILILTLCMLLSGCGKETTPVTEGTTGEAITEDVVQTATPTAPATTTASETTVPETTGAESEVRIYASGNLPRVIYGVNALRGRRSRGGEADE